MRGVVVSDILLFVARVIKRKPTIIGTLDMNPVVHIGSGQFDVHASAYHVTNVWKGYSGSPWLYLESFEW